jgi:hypothetical protein
MVVIVLWVVCVVFVAPVPVVIVFVDPDFVPVCVPVEAEFVPVVPVDDPVDAELVGVAVGIEVVAVLEEDESLLPMNSPYMLSPEELHGQAPDRVKRVKKPKTTLNRFMERIMENHSRRNTTI